MAIDFKTGLEVDERGVILTPVTGYKTATLPGGAILLVLSLEPRQSELDKGWPQTLQAPMTVAQARAIGQALLDAVVAAEMGHAPSKSKN